MHQAFALRKPREKQLLLFAGLFLILYGGYLLLIEPTLDGLALSERKLNQQQQELTSLNLQLQELATATTNPDTPLLIRRQALESEIAALRQVMLQQTSELIPAARMKNVLQQLLAHHDQLRLVELKSLTPTAITAEPQQEDQQAGLYQHGMRLVLEGSYFDLQGYLRQLESLQWRFYWKTFDYQVLEYPTARMSLEIYTLSTGKAFLGV
nr:type II secretion system protein GspM [Bowmanella dokdonensis]